MLSKEIWIAWHGSQRSRNLSRELGVPLFEKVIENNLVSRHLFSSLWTIYTLLKTRPGKIYLQYSFILLVIVAAYKRLTPFSVHIICDCHTKALRRSVSGSLGKVFWYIKKGSFCYTDVCIISNVEMEADIKILTDRYFVLPDKIPDIKTSDPGKINEPYCVFVGSYAVDEPLDEVIAVAERLEGSVRIYCTGKIPENLKPLKNKHNKNIYFTDYLSSKEYYQLLSKADCILALTGEEGCLQCAGYEALSVEVPMVLSDTTALKTYFESAAVYVKHNAQDMEKGIKYAINNRAELLSKMSQIKKLRDREFRAALSDLKRMI